jgi:iron complex outermembrane receptor protein
MIGGAVVHAIGPNTFKLRAAYGRGIRPPDNPSRFGSILGLTGTVDPEQQSGIEAGADIFFGKHAAIHATRFDQRASGLIQPVGVYATSINDSMPHFRRIVYELQNVGEISNRGWEFQGSVGDGPWSVGGTLSQVDSRVRKLAERYTGDLRPGDRMLEVPAMTLGLNAMYAHSRWSMAWRVSRASDWINYDRLSLLQSSTAGLQQDIVGSSLRSYWRSYDGVTRLGARAGMNVTKGMTLTLDGENLLDEQRGEPDNITVLPGRTITAGLRISF